MRQSSYNITDYYRIFKRNSNKELQSVNEKLNIIINKKKELLSYIETKKDYIINKLNINITNYIEYNGEYNSANTLYQKALKLYKNIDGKYNLDDTDKSILIQIIKLCNLLYNEHKCNILIKLHNKRKNLSLKDYKTYIYKYYTQVHKTVLEGNGYRFGYGIGVYIINQWKIPNMKYRKINYAETNRLKKEILDKGLPLYDENEERLCKEKGIPYLGQRYKVYYDTDKYYEITFIRSKIFNKKSLNYKHPEYVNSKYKGLSYKEIAEYVNNIDDISKLQVDIRYKLNILLYKFPMKQLNFIRNEKQLKYKYREDNS